MAWQRNVKLIIDDIFERMRQKTDDGQKTDFAQMCSNSNFRSSAVKFLMARKFNVERSLVLYQQHELMRLREGLSLFDSTKSPLREELLTGKFTVLTSRDKNGAALALFHAHKHDPTFVTHRTTLQGVVYQLDVAMEDPATQRAGIVFIYNMSGTYFTI